MCIRDRSLLAYYNLEQYPDTYLFYGPMFSDIYAGQDSDIPYKDDIPKYERDYKINKYIIVNDWKNGKINSIKSFKNFYNKNLSRYFNTIHLLQF